MDWIKKYWWTILFVILTIFILIVVLTIINITIEIISCKSLIDVTKSILESLTLIITPLAVISGLIIGYPLLKHKLVESYITNQFNIIDGNNRKVKKECLRLQEKYPDKNIATSLTNEYLEEAVQDMYNFKEMTVEANQNAYKYSYIVYKALRIFADRYTNENKSKYYNEIISKFIHWHLCNIYKYLQSIGYVSATIVNRKPILVDKLKRYVTDNYYYHVDDIDQSLSNKPTSALLVSFFSTALNSLSSGNELLFQCCYEVVPSPSSFVRIMFNREIYIPPILFNEKVPIIFDDQKPCLYLVGFKRIFAMDPNSETITNSYDCYYDNISEVGFVSSNMKDRASLKNCVDEYI